MPPKIELLAPAGSYRKLEYAYAFGADAAYIGVPFFSLRARENEFNLEELERAIQLARRLNKKIYVTANVFARNRKISSFEQQMQEWVHLKPDALIMSDPGLMMMVREKFPEIPLHLSVQANCMNWQGVKFWHKSLGVERVILSRELHVNEIREIKQRVPEVELEAFVHGAICIAYSGRCLMSSYFSYRDANQGVCDNSCREKFKVFEVDKKQDKDYYLEDLRNKGEFYQIEEDENGTYLMNAKDLRLIDHLKEIIDAGVISLKIEGRTKSEHYVALVCRSYRRALSDLEQGKGFDPALYSELDKIANRGYHSGFMVTETNQDSQNYDASTPRYFTQKFAGLILESTPETPEGYIPFEVRNKLMVGQECEILEPQGGNHDFTVQAIMNAKMMDVPVAHGGTGLHYIKFDRKPEPFSILSVKTSHFHKEPPKVKDSPDLVL
ncbi:MAG TPA: U32 family peptidase C-terminal domain-containing protein [Pseudobdellovibrionaceae bacterium]|nr:U32 family peptidase C-terminal domain-containing protein [Pseudobdellovibrionaceae bacterium]